MRVSSKTFFIGCALSLCVTSKLTPAHADFFFHDGDKPVAFLGDSITEPGMYTSLVESYVDTRYPKWNVTFRNIGWGGDTASLHRRGGIDNGLKRDILSLKPMAITIDFGMNDARSGERGLQTYIDSQTKLVEALKAAGARVALITPSPEEKYEANQPAGSSYNNLLWKYSQALRELAAKEN